jgi:hypothetical protein
MFVYEYIIPPVKPTIRDAGKARIEFHKLDFFIDVKLFPEIRILLIIMRHFSYRPVRKSACK